MAAKGTKVGSGYVTIYSEFDKGFGSDLERETKNALGRTQKPVSKFTQNVNAKAVAMGNIMSSVAVKGFGAITSHAGKAITRLDTIKSYPKTMQSLGYSTEEAAHSIEQMNKHLIGLPTATADLTGFVKGLASSGMELGRATDIGLAFNDMLLAGGASSAEAASAMEQYNQMVAVGKVDLQSWKIIQEKCAGQLAIVAEQLLGTGANATDLYNAMKDGTVSFDDFNNAMLKCANEGGDGFDGFAKAAKLNCGGIQTAIDNVSNRFDQALADVMDAIGQENITEFLDKLSSKFKPIAEKCIPVIADLALKFLDLATECLPLMDYIPELTLGFIALKAAVDGIKVATIIGSAAKELPNLSTALKNLKTTSGDAWAAVELGAEAAYKAIKNFSIGDVWAGLQLGAEVACDAIKGAAGDVWAGLQLGAEVACDAIKGAAGDVWAGLQLGSEAAFPALKTAAGEAWAAIQLGAEAAYGAIMAHPIAAAIAAAAAALVYFFTQTETGRELWAQFTEFIGEYWEIFCEKVSVSWERIKGFFSGIAETMQPYWETFCNVAQFTWQLLCEALNIAWELFKAPLILSFNIIKASWDILVQLIQIAWEALCELLGPVFDFAKEHIVSAISAIHKWFTETVAGISEKWDNLCNFVETLWEKAAIRVRLLIHNIQSAFDSVVEGMRDLWERFSNFLAPPIQAVVNTLKSMWNGFKSFMSGVVTAIADFFSSLIPSGVKNAFTSAKNAAIEQVNKLKDKIKNVVDTIAGFFSGAKLQFPHIPLPHPHFTGHFSLNPPSVPHFTMDWYAKGGVFDSPSVIGVGEAGREAVLPIDKIKPYFHEAAAEEMTTPSGNEQIIVDWLDKNLGAVIANYAPTATPREFKRMVNASV